MLGQSIPVDRDDAAAGLVRPLVPRGCTCRAITVEAENIVKNAEVETGDATVVNRSVTYIAPSYGDDEVEIEQDAEAKSGDAIAGQVLAVDGGDGCSRVTVHAKNVVRDSEVKSGDATARNESVVLVDPQLQTEDLEIEVDQEAEAESGDAIAGQIIGIEGGGGPCGGVILKALNDVRDVDVQTGDAFTENLSEILACADAGCAKELRASLADVPLVDVCDDTGCHPVKTEKFIEMLKQQPSEDDADADTVGEPDPAAEREAAAAADDDDDDSEDSDEGEDDDEVPLEERGLPRWFFAHQPRQASESAEQADEEPSPAPSPTPQPSPSQ